MSVTGDIYEVKVPARGSQLVGVHTASATSITVANPTDFDTSGGTLLLDGVVYAWTSVTVNGTDDDATGTLAITPALSGADKPDTLPVELWSGAQVIKDVVLMVDSGGETPAAVTLKYWQRKDWSALEGILEPPVPATFSDDFDELLDADGYTPTLDASNAQGLPDAPTVAVAAPTTTPTLSVTGFPTSVLAAVTNQPDSPSMVRFYISTSSASPMDSTTAVTDSREFVRSLSTLADGTPLALSTGYYVAAAFTNNQGTGPATAWQPVSLNSAMIEQIAAQVATLGAVITGQISVGLGYWNPNEGLVLPNPGGSKTVFPVDGVTPATIAGYLIALSMTVNAGMNVYGTSRFYGVTTLANGVADPTAPAQGGQAWNSVQSDMEVRCYGLTDSGSSWVTAYSFGTLGVAAITKAGGSVPGSSLRFSVTGTDGFVPYGGIVKIGSAYYVLGQRPDGSWWVYVLNTSFVKTSEWQWNISAPLPYLPAIGVAGSNILLARSNGSGIRIETRNTAGAVASAIVDTAVGGGADITSAYRGSADIGDTRFLVTTRKSILSFDLSSAQVVGDQWAPAGSTQILGMHWDGTRFHHYDSTGKIWDYNTNPTDLTRDVAYSWMDNDTSSGSTTHETRAELTRASVTWKKRTLLTIGGQTAPEASVTDPTKRDKANLLRFYAGTTAGTLYAQSIGTLGQLTSAGIATLATTTAAQTTNQFIGIAGSVGALVSAGSKTSFSGDDTYALNGTWTLETSGTLTAITGLAVSYRVVNGKVRVKCTTTGTPTIATGTTTVATGALPSGLRPATIETGSAVCQGQAATLRVNTDGTVSVIQNNAASRNTCDGNVEYDRP